MGFIVNNTVYVAALKNSQICIFLVHCDKPFSTCSLIFTIHVFAIDQKTIELKLQ